MGRAKVVIERNDLSARVRTAGGVTGGIVGGFKRGPLVPTLVTSSSQFLQKYTPDEKLKVGYTQAYHSILPFLKKSDRCYVVRVVNGALYGGLVLLAASSSAANYGISAGEADPEAFTFDNTTSPGTAQITDIVCEAAVNDKYWTLYGITGADNGADTKYHVWYNLDAGGTDPAPVGSIAIEVALTGAEAAVPDTVANKTATAIAAIADFGATDSTNTVTVTGAFKGLATDALDGDTGWTAAWSTPTPGVDVDDNEDLLFIHASDPGDWVNSKISIQCRNYTESPGIVKLANAFILYVYKDNVLVEQHTCSRDPALKDGFGKNIYVETALVASNYISAVDNVAIANTVLPKEQTVNLNMLNGDDGSAIEDAQLIAGANLLANPNEIKLQTLMDGGYTTESYQNKLLSIVAARGDSVACLGTPLAAEDAADYIGAITTYRTTTLNADESAGLMISPHVIITEEDTARDNLVVPSDGILAGAISENASTGRIWLPRLGKAKVDADDVNRNFSDGDLDAITDLGIIPIRNKPGKGISLWGQGTLQVAASSTDRANVVLLLITIEPAIKDVLEDFHFEVNEPAERRRLKAIVDAYMRDVQAGRGVYDFLVVCDETNNTPQDVDNYILNFWLYIEPTKGIEQIRFKVNIMRTGGIQVSLG